MTPAALTLLLFLQPVQFRISTIAVPVDVFVSDDGKAIAGLTREDFEVYDERKLQRVDDVSFGTVPVHVMLVLDTSTSVAGEKLQHLRAAADGFLRELAEDDRAGLLTFSHHLKLRSPLSSEHAALSRLLDDAVAEGATSWRDALFATLEILEPVRERPMVLLFTDGADTYSWLTEEQMPPIIQRSDAVVYAVTSEEDLGTPDLRLAREQTSYLEARRERRERTRLLRRLTEESGGRLVETRSSDRLQATFLEILNEMKSRYVLTYSPTSPMREGWHDIEVRVKRKGAEVHARKGYYYAAKR
jgi:VWFA-related protein